MQRKDKSYTGKNLHHLPHSLRDLRLAVLVDSREQDPLPINKLPTERAGLYMGDYSVKGLEHHFAVERKSLDDLASCCCAANRNRFKHELVRLRGARFARLLIIGTRADIEAHKYRSRISPQCVLGTLDSIEWSMGVAVVHCEDAHEGALLVARWAFWVARSVVVACDRVARQNGNFTTSRNPA